MVKKFAIIEIITPKIHKYDDDVYLDRITRQKSKFSICKIEPEKA
jgi:hypothetical protein